MLMPQHPQRERAAEWIYKRYFGYLMAICLRYVRHREEAEEVVSESFVKVFTHMPDFQGKGASDQYEPLFKGWMARICVNASIDFLRRKKELASTDDEGFSESKMPYIEESAHLHVQDIYKLLARLPDTQRMIFNLFEVEGYSHEEISVLLNIPEGTCRTYLMRAKQKLRTWYLEDFTTVESPRTNV